MKKLIFILMLTMGTAGAAQAQGCSVCTKTTQGFGAKSARGLNLGILFLAFLPLGIMGTVGYTWWRYNKQG